MSESARKPSKSSSPSAPSPSSTSPTGDLQDAPPPQPPTLYEHGPRLALQQQQIAALKTFSAGRLLLKQLEEMDRTAFKLPLITALAAAPSVEDMARFAAAQPDRWSQLLWNLGRLNGFWEVELKEEAGTVSMRNISQMSDAELLTAIGQMDQKLDALLERTPSGLLRETIDIDDAVVVSATSVELGDEFEALIG